MPALSSLIPLCFRPPRTMAAVPAAPAAPLDLPSRVGAAGWARLPAAVQRRFGPHHGDARYRGTMALRCSPIGRVFATLSRAFGGPLTSLDASGMPATVRVHHDGRGGVVWERLFHGDGQGARRVRSTKEAGPDGGLRERTDGGLSMALDVYEQDGSLVFRSRSFSLVRGRWRLPVPALLTPGTCTVTHTDLGHGFFRFELSMVHPLWGETFHQLGVFADPR